MTDRRQILQRLLLWLVGGLAGFLVLDVWWGTRRFSARHWRRIVALDDLPPEGTLAFPEERLALLLEPGRMAALNLECTHLGCLVNPTASGFFCPCHGSEFGPRGTVWSGPAPSSLPWHRLRLQAGAVWVLSGQKQTHPFWHARPSAAAKEVS